MNIKITDKDLSLFGSGTHSRCYDFLGAHFCNCDGVSGIRFSVWAPMVKSVSVIGTFNGWQGGIDSMTPIESSGIWTAFVPGIKEGVLYKYLIETDTGELIYKADPFAFAAELRPGTASLTVNLSGYQWRDSQWLSMRAAASHFDKPMNIYEVHTGSWKRHGVSDADEPADKASNYYTYRELADTLVPYVKDMGYTHVELLPVMEHPFDGSWGYQVTGYFAPTSRFGTTHDFMYFIDVCHCAGIGVILDWVPGHFCRDAHGLGRFIGTKLYEIDDHAQWGTYKFDFGRPQVRSFLLSSAMFWLDKYHIDGFRVDGVSSMLYLNFGEEGSCRTNSLGGCENLEAISFLQEFNRAVGTNYPGVFTAAEESSAWPLVTKPPEIGGLGFHYKWDMGWMNDTLRYMSLDFDKRMENHNLLTFSAMYAFSENFILPLSHDEVVHGKRSLIGRMPGDYWRQFAGLRLLMLYQICHTGAKLSFMGNEFGLFIEWRYYEGLEWFLLEYDTHSRHLQYVRALNRLYLNQPALWEYGYDTRGFSWIEADNNRQSVLIFKRQGRNEDDFVIAVMNFQPVRYDIYAIGVPLGGQYSELINSDDKIYGGSGCINNGNLTTVNKPMHGQKYTLTIKLPPLGGVILGYIPE